MYLVFRVISSKNIVESRLITIDDTLTLILILFYPYVFNSRTFNVLTSRLIHPQALCSQLLESREATPYRHPGADADRPQLAVLGSDRALLPELGHQPAAGNDQPESRLQEGHVRVPPL